MVDLQRPVKELRDLLALGQLHRKVAYAWGFLSFDADLIVSSTIYSLVLSDFLLTRSGADESCEGV